MAQLEAALAASRRYQQPDHRLQTERQNTTEDGARPLVENPVFAVAKEVPAQATDGSLSENQTEAVQKLLARMTQAPPNLHQFTCFALSRSPSGSDAAIRRKGPALFALSFVIVALQTMTAVAVFQGTAFTSCATNDACPGSGSGMYCELSRSRCRYCGDVVVVPMENDQATGATYNDWKDDAFAGYNSTAFNKACSLPSDRLVYPPGAAPVQRALRSQILDRGTVSNWCDACHHVETGSVNILTKDKHYHGSIAAMLPVVSQILQTC
eukprot:SAG31_NODE_1626_length_7710_cov_28.409933_1_plen_268_part_00